MTSYRRSGLRLCLVPLILACLFAASCDEPPTADNDDDNDADQGDDDFHISVDGSLKLSVMTSFEAYQLCKDIAKGFNRIIDKELQCLRTAIFSAQIPGGGYDEGVCNETFMNCSTENMKDYQTCDKYKETSDKYVDCDARVSEMDKCVQKTLSALEDEYSDLTCASGKMLDPHEIDPCAACEELEDECPGVTTNFDRLF